MELWVAALLFFVLLCGGVAALRKSGKTKAYQVAGVVMLLAALLCSIYVIATVLLLRGIN